MSERLPRLTAREIIRVLERRGFFLAHAGAAATSSTRTRRVGE